MEEEIGSGSRTKGQMEKKERKKEGRIKMGTGSGTHGETKSRPDNRGEGLSNIQRDADWDKEMEKVKTAMGWRTCF